MVVLRDKERNIYMCGSPFYDCKSRWYHQPVFFGDKILKVCSHCPPKGKCEKHSPITKYIGDVSVIDRTDTSILVQEHHNIGKALFEFYLGTGIPGLPEETEELAYQDDPWHYVRVRLANSHIPAVTLTNNLTALLKKGWLKGKTKTYNNFGSRYTDYEITKEGYEAVILYFSRTHMCKAA